MHFNSRRAKTFRCAALMLFTVFTGQAETTNLTPVADTTLHEFEPTYNFGGGDSFTAGGRNQGGRARGLLRFDIASRLPAGAVIQSASLTVRTIIMANGSGSIFDLHRVQANWGEGNGNASTGSPLVAAGDATWNLRQSPTPWAAAGGDYAGASSASRAITNANENFTFSAPGLAADVQEWLDHPGTNFGWLLRSQSELVGGTIRRFGSRLNATAAPVLHIEYTVGAAPAAPPDLFDVVLAGNEIRFSFHVESNRTYSVEFRDTLGTTNWNTLTNIPALPSAEIIHVTNGATGNELYFRARTP
jgi:hypothetical protein